MRRLGISLVCTLAGSVASAVDVGEYAQDLGGNPVPVGAGPRALGMGGAFTSIADDGTANTWNPGGMIQLERPEIAASFAYRYDRIDGSDGDHQHATDTSLDHLSLVVPFYRFGVQQTLGVAWQRRLDFTRSILIAQHDQATGSNTTLTSDTAIHVAQDGGFASMSASYAIEIVPGLGIGATALTWGDDWTHDSRYHRHLTQVQFTTLDLAVPPISIHTRDDIRTDSTITVKEGYSFVLGCWWQATPSLSLAATVKPQYRLRLASEGTERQTTTDLDAGMVIADNATQQTAHAKFTYPTSATIAGAWRVNDEHTFAADVGWTRWREYRIEQDGSTKSPVNPLIDPSRFNDTYSLRLGYEHLTILPRAVLVERLGAFYEGLPGATPVSDTTSLEATRATTDHFYGATAGLSLCLRSVLYDLSVQGRLGHRVGSSQYASPDKSAEIRTITVGAGVTYQF